MASDAAAAALAALNQTVKGLKESIDGLANDVRVLENTLDHAVKVAEQRG